MNSEVPLSGGLFGEHLHLHGVHTEWGGRKCAKEWGELAHQKGPCAGLQRNLWTKVGQKQEGKLLPDAPVRSALLHLCWQM